MAIFYPMLFLSGAAIPRSIMPDFLQQIAGFLPLTHVVILVEDLWLKDLEPHLSGGNHGSADPGPGDFAFYIPLGIMVH